MVPLNFKLLVIFNFEFFRFSFITWRWEGKKDGKGKRDIFGKIVTLLRFHFLVLNNLYLLVNGRIEKRKVRGTKEQHRLGYKLGKLDD